MCDCPQHTFQVLTKRRRRLRELSGQLPWPPNVWMGVSVENGNAIFRIRDLQGVPSAVRFLSCEPPLGLIERLPLQGIDRVIVGGESGPGARPMRLEWMESILWQCGEAGVPYRGQFLILTIGLAEFGHFASCPEHSRLADS